MHTYWKQNSKFWRERRKFMDLFPCKIYQRKDPHDMTSQRPKILCVFTVMHIDKYRHLVYFHWLTALFSMAHLRAGYSVTDVCTYNWWSLWRNSRPQINTCVSTPCPNLSARMMANHNCNKYYGYSINSFDWISTINTVIIVDAYHEVREVWF